MHIRSGRPVTPARYMMNQGCHFLLFVVVRADLFQPTFINWTAARHKLRFFALKYRVNRPPTSNWCGITMKEHALGSTSLHRLPQTHPVTYIESLFSEIGPSTKKLFLWAAGSMVEAFLSVNKVPTSYESKGCTRHIHPAHI